MFNFILNNIIVKFVLIFCFLVILFIFQHGQKQSLKNPCMNEYNFCSLNDLHDKYRSIFK